MRRFWFWLTHNASSAHHRLLAHYLQRRGWVVFYLENQEEQLRCHPGCFAELYRQGLPHERGWSDVAKKSMKKGGGRKC